MPDTINFTVNETVDNVEINVVNEVVEVNVIRQSGGGGAVDSVNGQTGVVVLDAGAVGAEPVKGVDDNYVTDAEKNKLANLSGTNTGDQDLSGLQPKEIGKGLSQENYTTTEKNKLASITAIFTTALKTAYDSVVTDLAALMLTGQRLITTGEISKLSNVPADTNTALSGKEPAITAGTTAQYWRGDKSWQTLPSGGGFTIIQFCPLFPFDLLNKWYSWGRNTSNMMTENPVGAWGTGTNPTRSGTNFADNNSFKIDDMTKLKSVNFSCKMPTATEGIQIQIYLYDFSVNRGYEPNEQKVVDQTVSGINGESFSFDLTVAANTINANTIMHVFARAVSGTASNVQGVQLTYKFE